MLLIKIGGETERPYTILDSLIIATVPESNNQKDVHRTLFRK
tara:strand:+ start:31 stop:156 length:126 start_codon:yes stop_codon:yes gene_type:complete